MGLDIGLLEDTVEYLKNNDLDLIHIKEIYRFLNENYDFTERQLSEHKQMAGQKEPNWMHDLRNLMGGAKGEGGLINPKQDKWGIVKNPITDFDAEIEFDSMVKEASKLTRSKEKLSVYRASKDTFFRVVSFSSKEIKAKKGILFSSGLVIASFSFSPCRVFPYKWEVETEQILFSEDVNKVEFTD